MAIGNRNPTINVNGNKNKNTLKSGINKAGLNKNTKFSKKKKNNK